MHSQRHCVLFANYTSSVICELDQPGTISSQHPWQFSLRIPREFHQSAPFCGGFSVAIYRDAVLAPPLSQSRDRFKPSRINGDLDIVRIHLSRTSIKWCGCSHNVISARFSKRGYLSSWLLYRKTPRAQNLLNFVNGMPGGIEIANLAPNNDRQVKFKNWNYSPRTPTLCTLKSLIIVMVE